MAKFNAKLGWIGGACGVVALVAIGCAADGASEGAALTGESASPTEPAPIAAVDKGTDSEDDTVGGESTEPTPGTNTGADASTDAGPQPIPPPVTGAPWPAPKEGDSCAKADDLAYDWCGKCGVTSAVCQKQADGSLKWGKYAGFCDQEVGECTPGEAIDGVCGNCGTQKKTCNPYGKKSNSCKWTTAKCVEPVGSCKPEAVEYTAASCDVSGTYRKRTCDAACTWSAFSECATVSADATVNVPALDQTAGVSVTFSTAQMADGLEGYCPAATLDPGAFPYRYVAVKNTRSTAATVTGYLSAVSAGGKVIDTVMATYNLSSPPLTAAQRKACDKGISDDTFGANETLTGDSRFSAINSVTIPAGGTVIFYMAPFLAYDATLPDRNTGTIRFNVKTTAL